MIARRFSLFMCLRPLPPPSLSWGHEPICTGIRWLSSGQDRLACWSCGKLIHLPEDSVQFFCPCENRVVLPPTTDNYFEIMGWYVTWSQTFLTGKVWGETLPGNVLSARLLPLALKGKENATMKIFLYCHYLKKKATSLRNSNPEYWVWEASALPLNNCDTLSQNWPTNYDYFALMPLFMIENVVLFKKRTEDLKIWKGSLQARLKSRGIQWYTS